MNKLFLNEINETYTQIKPQIEEKLKNFRSIWESRDEVKIFKEFLFCLLTPQSKAENAWSIIQELEKKNLLFNCSEFLLKNMLKKVRFRNKKAKYVRKAQDLFVKDGKVTIIEQLESQKTPVNMREWLVKNVDGMGYKEASHFLRNIGLGENLTILDRHILRYMVKLKAIEEIPKSLTKRKYLEIEEKLRNIANSLNIPIAHLDFVIWQIESNRIFK